MAATVEGFFVLHDRASNVMRRMEAQATATDSSIKRLGSNLDKNVGTTRQTRQIENAGRAMRNLERDSNRASGSSGGGGVRRLGNEADGAGRKLDRVLLKLVKFSLIMKGLRFGVMGAGIGVLVQAVGNLATGLASMVPALTRAVGVLGTMIGPALSLGGALSALPATLVGIVGGATVAKFAFSDLSQAMKGNQQALKRLTPEARAFLNLFNKEFRPMLNRLRVTAQGGLFAGLTVALGDFRRAFPVVNALVADFSKRLGDLARTAGARFTQPGFLRDLFSIGQQGGRILTRFGSGVMNLIDALRNVAMAAQPFTEWLSKTVVNWTRFVDQWALAGRESGRFASFLGNVRTRLKIVFDIVRNLTVAAEGFFRAADPVGMGLFRSLDATTARWARFMNTVTGEARIRTWAQGAARDFHMIWDILVQLTRVAVELGRAGGSSGNTLWGSFDHFLRGWNAWARSTPGQLRLIKEFQTVVPGFEAIARLFLALGQAVLQMGQNPGLAGMVTNLQRLIPMLQNFLNTLVTQLGPPLVNILVQAGRLLTTLTQAGGPLSLFLSLVGKVLGVINTLAGAIPGLGFTMAAVFSVVMVNRFIAKLGQATAAMLGLRNAAAETAAAEGAAMGGGAMIGPGLMRGGRGRPGWGAVGALAGGSRVGRFFGDSRMRFGLGRLSTTAEEAGSYGRLARLGFATRAVPGLGRLAGLGAAGGMAGGMLGRLGGAGRLARFGRFASPAGIAAGIAGLGIGLVPDRYVPGGATTKGVATDVATGAALGSFIGPWGTLAGAGVGLGYGLAKDVFHPFGWGRHGTSPQDIIGQQQYRLRGMGGSDPSHGQLVQQVTYLRSQTRAYAHDTSATGQQVTAWLRQELSARRQVLGQQNAQIRAEKQIRAENSRRVNVGRARQFGRALGTGYDQDVARLGQPAAFDQLLARYRRLARGLSEQGRQALAKPLVDWANQMHQQGRLPMSEVDKLNAGVKQSFDGTRQHIEIVNGQILTGATRGWTRIRQALQTQADLAKSGLSNTFDQIQALARGKLLAMGFSGGQIGAILRAAAAGRNIVPGQMTAAQQANNLAQYRGRASGGRVVGSSTADTVPIMAGAGELVVNRHTEGRVNRMLAPFGTNLGREATMETRRHQFATGGRAPAGGGIWAGVHPAVHRAANLLTSKFPLTVTSTTRGGHASGSYHYLGEAVDLAGAPGAMNQAAAWIASSGMARSLTEGIHNPNLSISKGAPVAPSFWGGATWGAHRNHIHIAIAGALGALAAGRGRGGAVNLRAPTLNIPGVGGLMAQAAANAYAGGLGTNLTGIAGRQRRVTGRGGGGGGGGDQLPGGTAGSNQALGRRLMLAHGWGAGQWPALRTLWTRESGWRTNARNPSSGAYGIPQSLPANKMASAGGDWMTNPATQIRWGLGYIAGRYGSPAGAWAHEQRVGWYGNGMTGTFHRPTVIGVGDSGSEHVTVTPAHSRRAGGVRVNIERIDYRGEGDIEKVVSRELDAAFAKFSTELAHIGVEDD